MNVTKAPDKVQLVSKEAAFSNGMQTVVLAGAQRILAVLDHEGLHKDFQFTKLIVQMMIHPQRLFCVLELKSFVL